MKLLRLVSGILVASYPACTARTARTRVLAPAPTGEQGVHETVTVTAPMVIGFFPHVTQAEVDAEEGLSSALEHFQWALDRTSACLRPRGIEVQEVQADVLDIVDGGNTTTLTLSTVTNDNIGCYLVEPKRLPSVVRATVGPSSLVYLCPAAASVYFSAPGCCPEGFTCCPDGVVKAEGSSCDG